VALHDGMAKARQAATIFSIHGNLTAGPVGYDGPCLCAAHVTLAELSSDPQLTVLMLRLHSAVVEGEVRGSDSG
jgi:hypothetical protein